jgi:hypothetical protein
VSDAKRIFPPAFRNLCNALVAAAEKSGVDEFKKRAMVNGNYILMT